jgi:hypothetical protein
VTLAAEELADAILDFEAAYDNLFRASYFGSIEEWSAAAERYRRAGRRKAELERSIGWEGRVS